MYSLGTDDTEDHQTQVLADIKALFAERASLWLSSEEMVNHLVGLEDRPWAEFRNQQKPLSNLGQQLAGVRVVFLTQTAGGGLVTPHHGLDKCSAQVSSPVTKLKRTQLTAVHYAHQCIDGVRRILRRN